MQNVKIGKRVRVFALSLQRRRKKMYHPSNTKIENRAIGALRNIVDEHLTMDSQFNSMDKEMAWDGYIYIFKNNNGDQSKRNLDDKVPVQIKGHIDKEQKYLNKKRITYPVDLADLEIYYNDRGILYFEIFMTEDGKRVEIFYSSLFPSKIKTYLEKASHKENKEMINIPFSKLQKDSESLYIIVKQFSTESRTQGFGSGEIVQNMIMFKDMDKVTSITMTAVGAKNELEILERLSTGDICFYGTTKENQIKVPLEWDENCKSYFQKEVSQAISIDGEEYYDRYIITASSDQEFILKPSGNLFIEMTKGKFHFKVQTGIAELRKDADFLLKLMKSTAFQVGNSLYPCRNLEISKEFEENLRFFIDLDDTLRQIEFDYNKPVKNFSEDVFRQLFNLLAVRKGLKNNLFKEKVHILNWKIEDKYLPVIVSRQDDGTNKLTNAIYTKGIVTAISDDKENYYKVPLFTRIDKHVICDLYCYNYDYFYEQIDKADVNEYTVTYLNHAALRLVQAYDTNKDKKLLEIAEYLLDKIVALEGEKVYLLINQFQIKKRQGALAKKEIDFLRNIFTEEIQEQFGIHVLLGNKEKAKRCYEHMGMGEREEIMDYPIYDLYQTM